MGIKFFRQYSIGPYIVDFYAPKIQLAVEIDDAHHYENEWMDYDARRSELLRQEGIRIIRFPNNQILSNITEVMEEIGRVVGNSPRPPLR